MAVRHALRERKERLRPEKPREIGEVAVERIIQRFAAVRPAGLSSELTDLYGEDGLPA